MILVFFSIIYLSITIPKYFYCLVSNKMGDATAENSHRLTLNPLAHTDIFGTLILPLLLFIASKGLFSVGYAKPLPINSYCLKNPKKQIGILSLIIPLVNICFALILTIILKTIYFGDSDILVFAIWINLLLAVFNLIPIPPLQGAKIMTFLLPKSMVAAYKRIKPYGTSLIIFAFLSGLLPRIIKSITSFAFNYVLRIDSGL